MSVQYIDRKTALQLEEKIYGGWAIKFIYGSIWVRWLMHLFGKVPWFSRLAGYLQNRSSSAKAVGPFIEQYGIDAKEFLEETFSSFNDFFIRKLKPAARPIVSDPNHLVLPADGRYLVFPDLSQVENFFVKGRSFDLKTFLRDAVLARRYERGTLVLARLCPTDYHRFHFPCSGIPGPARLIRGPLYSVNPIALCQRPSILWENKRMITEFETDRFGQILYVEIGATCVGTIHQTYVPDFRVKKGVEKGYFSFGGSSLALLFERRRVVLDPDLVANSEKGFETKANWGESLGRVP